MKRRVLMHPAFFHLENDSKRLGLFPVWEPLT